MRDKRRDLTGAVAAFVASLVLVGTGAFAQQSATTWQIWVGSHYSGLKDYAEKVAEFDWGTNSPEFAAKLAHRAGKNAVEVSGFYYDPKRMGLGGSAALGDWLKADISFRSFYRRLQNDLLENLSVREAKDRTGTSPGGKMITHDNPAPGATYGYTRREIKTNVEAQIPGLKALKLRVEHRSILEEGNQQRLAAMHCSSCHVQAIDMKVDRKTHDIAAGADLDVGPVTLSYRARVRQFRDDAPIYEVQYDTAQHPVTGALVEEFSSREIFSGQVVPINSPLQVDQLSHTFKAKARLGAGTVVASAVTSRAKNKVKSLNVKTNAANLRVTYPLFRKLKVVAQGSYDRIKNDPVFIDLPAWREGRAGGGQDFDWWRYSNLSRTALEASAQILYVHNRAVRFSLLGGAGRVTRDDYPYHGASGKTTTMKLRPELRLKFGRSLTARLRYDLAVTDNPFAPYNYFFERSGHTLTPLPDNKLVFYFQRDQLRYGNITSLPTLEQGVDVRFTFRQSSRVKVTAGVKATIGTNKDNKELSFRHRSLQPQFGVALSPSPEWSLFVDYSLILEDQNGLLSVPMMDG